MTLFILLSYTQVAAMRQRGCAFGVRARYKAACVQKNTMSHSDLATFTCQHPVTDAVTQSNMPTCFYYCDCAKQRLALLLPKAGNALSAKYLFLCIMISARLYTSLELKGFNTWEVCLRWEERLLHPAAGLKERAAEDRDAEQSKRKEHGGEGSRSRTAGLFCWKQSAAKWLTCSCIKVHTLIKEKEPADWDSWSQTEQLADRRARASRTAAQPVNTHRCTRTNTQTAKESGSC